MTIYPGAIDEFRSTENIPGITYTPTETTTLFAEDTNNHSDAIIAIESTLGTNPQGDFSNISDRLTGLDQRLPYCIVNDDTGIEIPNATTTRLIFTNVVFDDGSLYDNSTGIITSNYNATFIFNLSFSLDQPLSTGSLEVRPESNYGEFDTYYYSNLSAYDPIRITSFYAVSPGDWICFNIYQNSGDTIYLGTSDQQNFFKVGLLR